MAHRLSSYLLALAAGALIAYPLLRGYGLEAGLGAAELWARPSWLWAHQLAMAGFVLAGLGLRGVDRWAGRAVLVGAVLVLPYYGAEAYGLHAVGQLMLTTADPGMAVVADLFRFQPVALALFVAGWAAMAAGGVRLALLVRRSAGLDRWGLLLAAVGLATYLPQFFAEPAVRMTHGVLVGAGLLVLALRGCAGRSDSPR